MRKFDEEMNLDKKNTPIEEIAGKVKFDPQAHIVKKKDSDKKKCHKRNRKRDKKNIRRKKFQEKEKRYEDDYNDLMLTNLVKEFYTTKSPHLLISRRWFQRIKHSSIMLKEAYETTDENNRVIYYTVESFGDVSYTKKGNTWILNPSSTSKNTIFIVTRLRDVANIPKLQFHTELGKMIQRYDVDKERNECYILLSIIHIDKEEHKKASILKEEDFMLMKRFLINQVSSKKGNYHFNTKGIIYGLGYGPKCNRNEYGHSIGRFATRKYYC